MALPITSPEPETTAAPLRTPRRRLWADGTARWVVTLGGLGIIAGVLGILFFIVAEVLPLFRRASVEVAAVGALSGDVAALLGDEHRSQAVTLDRAGWVRVQAVADGAVREQVALFPGAGGEPLPLVLTARAAGAPALAASGTDGRVALVEIEWQTAFDAEAARTTTARLGALRRFDLDPEARPLRVLAARAGADGGAAVAGQLADGRLVIDGRQTTENAMTGEKTENAWRTEVAAAPPLAALALDADGSNLYGGTAQGELLVWPIVDGQLGEATVSSAGRAGISALALLLGDRSLVVGQADGALSVWFPLRQADDTTRLVRVRDFAPHMGAIRLLAASERNKAFLAQDDAGTLGLYYSTSGRTLWRGPSPLGSAQALFFSPKGDGALLAGQGQAAALSIRNPHPEVGLRALFGRVWYEGYDRPELVWQSTGGTDDFEPKLSLTPLLVGTLKGTFYSLLLAIPLGILGAMYASQFMHPNLQRVVKPTVEIMAALPSVVLGFLAGLWLAPVLEREFPALVAMLVVLPLVVLGAGGAWRAAPRRWRGRLPAGSEVFLYAVVLTLAAWGCLEASTAIERLLFGGDFPAWLNATTGLRYDQRNAVVVGIAMGFAVIPIIFAIAEDAFSNVPKNLVSGSLALGASRWQTVLRVVLPTASPGVFSAVMIGFGRAVGETMIVLMATGNTPIMSWNPFDGFRTLSANVAVEIPEAPVGGTLYRTLFLAALLLFIVTFLVNTVAELVRQRLRRRYAEL